MAVLVPLHVRHGLLQVVLIHPQGDALGKDDHPERPAVGDPLQHRRVDQIDQMHQLDGAVGGEFFGDHGERRPGRLPDPHGQMPGRSAHRQDEEPSLGGDGVGHQIVHKLHADVARRLEPEGRDATRKRQIVVDGLRDVGHLDGPAGRLGHLLSRKGGVVPSDRDERVDPQLPQRPDRVGHTPVGVVRSFVPNRRVGSGREQEGAT